MPAATTSTSASSVCRGRSRVCEWQIVTVAFACWSRRWAIGLPTMSLRPMTTARAPSSSTGARRAAPSRRRGVARHERRAAEVELAGVEAGAGRRRPSRGSIARMTRSSSMCAGSGSWTSSASTASSAFSSATRASSSSSARASGSATSVACDPGLGRGLVLQADVDLGRGIVADEHGHQPDVPEPAHLLGDLGPDPVGERLAPYQGRCHRRPSLGSPPCAGPGRTTRPRSRAAATRWASTTGSSRRSTSSRSRTRRSRSSASP